MNARTLAGCAALYSILAASAAVLGTDAPHALAQVRALAPPAARLSWSDRPPGVPPDRWIPINSAVGIVIDRTVPPTTDRPGRAIPPTLAGQFAVYHAGRWWRLRTNVASLVPLNQD